MKKILLLLLLCTSLHSFANHLKGGFFTYTYLGPGTNDPSARRYRVTLTVYMDCSATGAQINNPIKFTFFNGTSSTVLANPDVFITQQYNLAKGKDDECITGNQAICFYKIVIYDLPSIELPASSSGYTVSYQRCCRIAGINNLSGNSNTVGNTYSVFIPGSSLLPGAQQNSSATFQVNDTVAVCSNTYFQYSFLATDPDGDSLSYSFCNAWIGGDQSNPAPIQASPPSTYSSVQYAIGYGGTFPLGSNVTINSQTGLISGIAPSMPGEYVVTVCVNEYRNGVLLTTNRKELHIKIGDCNAISATLDPSYITCDGFNLSFSNNTPNGINSYFWDFGVTSLTNDTSNLPNPTYTFSDTGTYLIKLVVNRGEACSDSTTAIAKVYPGFFPGFTFNGVCVNKPTQFIDTTRTYYGFVDSWRWDFGDNGTNADTSRIQNPTYTYTSPGTKTITFVVSNSKGCVKTVTEQIEILTKPPLSVAFKDTLICNGDSVQLRAIGNGAFSWTPAVNIINGNTADPIVHPSTTTNYIVQLDDQGCVANDTVRVRVVNFVTLRIMGDTTICATDTLRLRAETDGLRFMWTNASTLDDPTKLQPLARPVTDPTVYTLTATIGRCSTSGSVQVSLVPYPTANAGNDTTICFNTPAVLNGSIVGNSHVWSPASMLTNANTLNPTATPRSTTAYVLSAFDTRGCPKPGRDTVLVTVNPEVFAFAGKDTAVVVGQTLQFNASGGETYQWSPSTALSSTTIPNPKAIYDGSFDSIRYTLIVGDSIGCTDEATILVKIFKTNPRIFVPTAFTPNGDGKNEFVAPVAVGITKIDYFRIYNRWGQLVFETTINGKGWDGKIAGKEQGTATYVWIVKGTDFTGKSVFEKGTVTLIR